MNYALIVPARVNLLREMGKMHGDAPGKTI